MRRIKRMIHKARKRIKLEVAFRKIGFLAKKEGENYFLDGYFGSYFVSLVYFPKRKNIYIQFLTNKGQNYSMQQIKPIYERIEKLAREVGAKEITTSTWIFVLHPRIMKVLGFEPMNPKEYEVAREKLRGIKSIVKLRLEDGMCVAKKENGELKEIKLFLVNFRKKLE
jgi:hypothetical protein